MNSYNINTYDKKDNKPGRNCLFAKFHSNICYNNLLSVCIIDVHFSQVAQQHVSTQTCPTPAMCGR